MMSHVDIYYMSGQKSGGARGGLIATNHKEHFDHLMNWLPVYEGFSTYGGMSTKEIEAMAHHLRKDFLDGFMGIAFLTFFNEIGIFPNEAAV